MKPLLLGCFLLSAAFADALSDSAQRKLDAITANKPAPGSTLTFTPAEINSWARVKLPTLVPMGVRNQYLNLGTDVLTGTALVDFLQVRTSLGQESGIVMRHLLDGERPVKAMVRIASANGRATVYLTRVEVSNTAADGSLLDFLTGNIVRVVYPQAKINEPIELDYRIDHIAVRPTGISVTIRK